MMDNNRVTMPVLINYCVATVVSLYNMSDTMLNSGKKIRALRDKKNKYSNSRVVQKKI